MNPVSDPSFHYVYVLRSKKNGLLYTGCTKNLRKRLKEHNDGLANYTKDRGPFELNYYESYRHPEDAWSREKHLKSGPGKRYLKERIKRFLSLTG